MSDEIHFSYSLNRKRLGSKGLISLIVRPVEINKDSHGNLKVQGGSNMTGTDFFFVTIIAHHSSNCQTGLNRF